MKRFSFKEVYGLDNGAYNASPLGLAYSRTIVEVSSAKPSSIQVGSNLDEVITAISNKINAIRNALESYTWTWGANFRRSGHLTNKGSDYTTNYFGGGLENVNINTDATKISLLRIKADGMLIHSNNSGHPALELHYECFTNNSSVDASFDERVYITYDKYTKTIEAVQESLTQVTDDKGIAELHAVVRAPELSSIVIGYQAHSDRPTTVSVNDPDLTAEFQCYTDNNGNLYEPNANYGIMVGSCANMVEMIRYKQDIMPCALMEYRDLTQASKPAIYSRI